MLTKIVKSMTLTELIIVIVLVGILATIGTVSYRTTMVRARNREGQSMLRLIHHAENTFRLETNTYAACNNNNDCNGVLHLNLPGGEWTFSVPAATATTFCAQADSAHYDDFHMGNADPDPQAGLCGG